jgi:hypothetical protein
MHSRESGIGGSESKAAQRGVFTFRAARAAADGGLTWRGSPPRFHESLWGVYSKLAYLNALSRRERRELGIEQDGGININRLRSLVPSPNHSRGAWSLQRVDPFISAPGEPSNFQRLRFCMRCLEGGFHSVIFQMPEVSRCVAHDTPLLECCPHCGRPIPYTVWCPSPHGPKPFECKCGQPIWCDRDTVSRWYLGDSKLLQLDQFVECLLDMQSASKAAWLRIDKPAVTINGYSWLGERLGSICPSELLKMPRKYYRYINVDVTAKRARRRNLLRSGARMSNNIALDEWCAALMVRVERRSRMVSTNHRECIGNALNDFDREGSAVLLTKCHIGNAFVFWKSHWLQRVNRRWLDQAVYWLVRATLDRLHETGALELIEGRGRAHQQLQAGQHCWPELWDFLGEQALIASLCYFVRTIPRVLKDVPSFRNRLGFVSNVNRMVPTELWGPIWLLIEPTRPHTFEIRYRDEEDLRDLNSQPCSASIAVGAASS